MKAFLLRPASSVVLSELSHVRPLRGLPMAVPTHAERGEWVPLTSLLSSTSGPAVKVELGQPLMEPSSSLEACHTMPATMQVPFTHCEPGSDSVGLLPSPGFFLSWSR